MPSGWFTLGRVVRPRGLQGELVVEGCHQPPERLLRYCSLYLDPPGYATKAEAAWRHQGRLIVKLYGIDTIAHAERFRGAFLKIPLEEREALPAGEYYLSDLAGCRVVDLQTGDELGTVADCYDNNGQILLAIGRGPSEWLIPFVSGICCEIDVAGKTIGVRLPEGLKDL